MRVTIFTLFPEWFASPLSTALLGRAVESGLLDFRLVNPRDWAEDRHRTTDDRPYGGGPGMVMTLGPLARALRAAGAESGGPSSFPLPGGLLPRSWRGNWRGKRR